MEKPVRFKFAFLIIVFNPCSYNKHSNYKET